jgi:hypothetical protein
MQEEYKLIQLESKVNKVSQDFDTLKESIIQILTIALVCFSVGLIVGCLL